MSNYNKYSGPPKSTTPNSSANYYAAPTISAPPSVSRPQQLYSSTNMPLAAQIAQQQMAYIPRHMLHPGAQAATPPPASTPSTSTVRPDGKRVTVVRQGGGKQWEDPSLLEWDPTHFRLFVGNIGGDVADDVLHKAFSNYPSLSKARVIRDKSQAGKSRGYGFVAFKDPEDYFRAFKEMNGKYIGSHPVLLRKAQTEIKAKVVKGSKPIDKATSAVLKTATGGHRIKKKYK
ncbi:RNA-binding domain-containing protein [Lipomyces doorenjongii]